MRLLALLSLLLLMAPAASATAVGVCARHTSSTAMDEMERAFIGAAQIGDGAASNDWEVRVGKTESGNGPPGTTANLVWTNGQATPFRLSWDPATQRVALRVGTAQTEVVVPATGADVWDLFIRARATSSSGTTLAGNFTLDHHPISLAIRAPAHDSLERLLHVGPPDLLSDGFVLTGNITFSWEGAAPQNNRLAVEFIAGTTPLSCFTPALPVPELSTLILATAGLAAVGLVVWRARR